MVDGKHQRETTEKLKLNDEAKLMRRKIEKGKPNV